MSHFLRMIDGKLKPLDEAKFKLGPTDPEPDDDAPAAGKDKSYDACPECGSGHYVNGKCNNCGAAKDDDECNEGFLATVEAKLKEGSSEESGSESGSGSDSEEINTKQFMEVVRRIYDNGTTIVAVTKHLAETAKHYGATGHPEVLKRVQEILKMSSTAAWNCAQLNAQLDKYVKKG